MLTTTNADMSDIAIIVVAYNRAASLRRLLRSLAMATYSQEVDLVISIDKGGCDAVSGTAHDFEWPFGKKRVIKNPVNLGLRRHILQCGDLTAQYEHIIVLEDDLFVSPAFFKFAVQAVAFYANDQRIAGISLYKHSWNYLCNRPFEPLIEESDVFFLQHAMSWGQVWSKRSWAEFRDWYSRNSAEFSTLDDFPDSIASWPSSSWLKYHNRYVHETNKYFVYPNSSLCTNFSDPGTHAQESTSYQVPLCFAKDREFRFVRFDDARSKYDIYFESLSLKLPTQCEREGDLTIDLYGQKRMHRRFVLSSRELPYEVLERFGLLLRPHELNVEYSIPGNFFRLYDTTRNAPVEYSRNAIELVSYDVRALSKRAALRFVFFQYQKALSNRVMRTFRWLLDSKNK